MGNDDFNDAVTPVIQALQNTITSKLLPIAVAFALVWMIYKYWAENNAPGVHFPEVIRIFVLTTILYSYTPVINFFDNVSNAVIGSYSVNVKAGLQSFYIISTAAEAQRVYNLDDVQTSHLAETLSGNPDRDKRQIKRYIQNLAQGTEAKGMSIISAFSDPNYLTKQIESIRDAILNALQTSLTGGIMFVVGIIKLLMAGLIAGFSTILKVTGSVAIVLDIIWKGTIQKWMKHYLTAKMAFLTFMIIESVILAIMNTLFSDFAVGTATISVSFNYLIVGVLASSVILYALVFWITDKYMFSTNSGGFLAAGAGALLMSMNKVVAAVSKAVPSK